MSQIQNIMAKRLITIPSGSTLSQATHLMQERRIRHLPVVTEGGAVLGILSSKNLPIFSELKEMSVDFFMTTDLVFVLNDSSIKEAIYKILENKISCLLVCDKEHNVEGVITTDDLLHYMVTNLDKEPTILNQLTRLFDAPTVSQIAHQLSSAGI